MVYAPVTHRKGTNTFVMMYALISKKVAGKFGPRLTGGGYTLPGRDDGAGDKSGFMAGYEQPLARRVSFVVDWASDHNRFGYVTPGFSFATTQHSNLYTGYSIGIKAARTTRSSPTTASRSSWCGYFVKLRWIAVIQRSRSRTRRPRSSTHRANLSLNLIQRLSGTIFCALCRGEQHW
jgi:hypothetical protein